MASFYSKGHERQPHRVVYEVKYRDELRQKWAELKPRFKATRRYAKAHGWEFRIITEREIRAGGLLWNAEFLLPYVYDEPVDPGIVVLTTNLHRLGVSTPGKLLKECSSDRWEQARLLTVLWQQVDPGRNFVVAAWNGKSRQEVQPCFGEKVARRGSQHGDYALCSQGSGRIRASNVGMAEMSKHL